jgi:hypothetical protein
MATRRLKKGRIGTGSDSLAFEHNGSPLPQPYPTIGPSCPQRGWGRFFDREQVAMSGVDRASGGILDMCLSGLSAPSPEALGPFLLLRARVDQMKEAAN